MSFISYAQTFEDVMLARALAGVARGFYIDVGAQDPRFDSVTKAFYDMGWHGINLEPVESWHRKLVAERPRDINLCLAAGDHEGSIEFHATDDSGLSTASAEFAARHRAEGHALRTRQVPVSTLDAICRAHAVREVHFLKVDVEGAEAEVLRGLDLARLRPWIILVEATEPNSRVSTHARWESLVTAHDYRMVYQDGLNRFYLAREHEDLAAAFDAPPNIFDDFVRREQVDIAAELSGRLEATHALLVQRTAHIDELASLIAERDRGLAERDAGIAERDARIVDLEERIAGLDAQLAAGEAMVVERDAWVAERDRLIAQRDAHIAALEAGMAGAEARLRTLDASIGVLRSRNAALSRDLMDAQAEALALRGELASAEAVARDGHARLAAADYELDRMLRSRSWRLTAPLRRTAARLRLLGDAPAHAARALSRVRVLRAATAWLLGPFPGVARAVKLRLFGPPPAPAWAPAAGAAEAPLPLTDDAEAVLARCPVGVRGGGG